MKLDQLPTSIGLNRRISSIISRNNETPFATLKRCLESNPVPDYASFYGLGEWIALTPSRGGIPSAAVSTVNWDVHWNVPTDRRWNNHVWDHQGELGETFLNLTMLTGQIIATSHDLFPPNGGEL